MLNLGKVTLVCWREYLENVKTKAFIFGVILTPLLMGAIFVVPLLFPQDDRRIVVVDGTGQLFPLLKAHFDARNQAVERGKTILVEDPDNLLQPDAAGAAERLAAAEERVQKEILRGVHGTDQAELFGALIIDSTFLSDDQAVLEGEAVRFHTEHPTEIRLPREIERLLGLLRRPLRTKVLIEREQRRNPTGFKEIPLERRVVAVDAAARAPGAPLRFHICDGAGLVLPSVEQMFGALRDGHEELMGQLPDEVRAQALAFLRWELDEWKAPAIERAQRLERVTLLQMGLDPDSLPSELYGGKDRGGSDLGLGAILGGAGRGKATVPLTEATKRFRARLDRGELDAFLVVRREFLSRATGPQGGDAVLFVREGVDPLSVGILEGLMQSVLWSQRYSSEILSANVTPKLSIHNPEKKGEKYENKDVAAKFIVPFIFVILLFYGVFGIAQALLNSVIEEKSNRIVEVLLSSLTPTELMLGKITGLGLVGFTLIALWVTAGYITAVHQFGGEFIALYLRPGLLAYFVIFYVLGFLFLASVIAAIGATCNTIKEAQNYLSVISILYIVPMLTILPVSEQPEGAMARALSFIPPLTPFVMMNRLAASKSISTLEVWSAIALLAVSLVLSIWLAARVFRVGILMYGKPPKLSEIWRWVRQG